jgi:hypothetical protein
MKRFDSGESSSMFANPWLFVLAGLVLVDFLAVAMSWTLIGLRRFRVGWLLSTVLSISISAVLLLDLAAAFVTG